MAQTAQRTREPEQTAPAAVYVYEIRLLDGGSLWARAGDPATAETELAGLHRKLGSDPFVRVADTIVRSDDVRSVQLHEQDDSEGGFLDDLKRRLGGGRMSSYETDERTTTTRGRQRPAERRHLDDDGPGFADRYVGYGMRPWSETKPFFLTSEFLTLLASIAAVAIGMAASDVFDSTRGFTLIAVLAAAYMISRGLAKSGTRDPNPEHRGRY
jgi:hypothetical protein